MATNQSEYELLFTLNNQISGPAKDAGTGLASVGVEAQGLERKLQALHEQQALIDSFGRLDATVQDSGKALRLARQEVDRLKDAFKTSKDPEIAIALQLAQAEASVASREFNQNARELAELRRALKAASLDTGNLAQAKQRIQLETVKTGQAYQRLNAELAQTRGAANAATRAVAQVSPAASGAAKDAESAFGKTRQGLTSISQQLADVKTQLIGLFGISQVGNFITDAVQAAEAWKRYEARLKLAADSQNELNRALHGTFDLAQRAGVNIEQVGNLYARLESSTERLGQSQKQVLGLTETISKAIQISGGSAETANAAIQQLSQGLASGVLRGDEFNSVMENAPRLAQAMADGLGVGVGELRKLAEQGKLTAEVVIKALQGQSGAIETEFAKLPNTVGKATARLSNEWQRFLGDLDKSSGATETLANGLESLATHLDDVAEVVVVSGAVIGGVFALRLLPLLKDTAAAFRYLGVSAMAGFTQAEVAASKSTLSIAGRLRSLGGVLKQALAVGAFEFAIAGIFRVIDAIGKLREAKQQLQDAEALRDDTAKALAADLEKLNARTGLNIRSVQELNAAYDKGLLIWNDVSGRYETAAEAAKLLAEQQARLAAEGKTPAAAWERINKSALELAEAFKKARESGAGLEAGIAAMLAKIKAGDGDAMQGLSRALRGLEVQGEATALQLTTGLGAALGKLEQRDYGAFKANLEGVLKGGGDAAQRLAWVVEGDLLGALQRLGVDGPAALGKVSLETQANIRDFEALARSGKLGGEALGKAFDTAVAAAKSQADLEALSAKVQALGKDGTLAGGQVNDALAKMQARSAELTPAIDSAAEAFKLLGITSQQELQKTAEEARKAFELIKKEGNLEDAKRAFLAYAEAAIKANGGVVSSTLEAQAAAYGLGGAIKDLSVKVAPVSKELEAMANTLRAVATESARETESIERAAQAKIEAAKATGDLVKVAEAEAEASKAIAAAKLQESLSAKQRLDQIIFEADADGKLAEAEKLLIEELRAVIEAKRQAAAAAGEKAKADAEAAAQARDLARDTSRYGADAARALTAVSAVVETLDPAFVRARDAVGELRGEFEEMYEVVFEAFGLTARNQLERVASHARFAAEALGSLKEATETGIGLDQAIADAELLDGTLSDLGAQELNPLREALDDARDRMRELQEESEDTLNDLQGELLELQGNFVELERLRQEQKRADLEARLSEAEGRGDEDGAAKLRQALEILQQVAALRLQDAERRQEQAGRSPETSARRQPSQPPQLPPAPPSTRSHITLTFQGRDGRKAAVDVSSREALDQLLSILEAEGFRARG